MLAPTTARGSASNRACRRSIRGASADARPDVGRSPVDWARVARAAPFATEDPISKLGRNDPCHCGSGKKYKKCHLAEDEAARTAELAAKNAAAAEAREAAEAAEAEAAEEGDEKKPEPKKGGFAKSKPTSKKPATSAPAAKPGRRRGVS
ncbi:MAG: SEC-C metal-binding domain-containing protein [Sandaracinaceae bacterium]|nr:MAG: hypothetical protein EVA89_37745 [Sandaracinaceae bacterium]